MPRLTPPMAERRARILEAARRGIADVGYDGLTLRALAREAQVTVPTIYNLVGNKDAVLVAAVADQTERFVRSIGAAPDDVLGIVDASARELLRAPRYYRALLRLLADSEEAGEARRMVTAALQGQLRGAVEALAAEKQLEAWVEVGALSEELLAVVWQASDQWARGRLRSAAFPARQRFGVALLLAGAARGRARSRFKDVARANQSAPAPAPRAAARLAQGARA
ncbi:MAG: helix-turn-helix domain-containing protein [Myxococcota bacterium]